MKNILAGFVIVMLLFACDFGNGSADLPADGGLPDDEVLTDVSLTDGAFITLSAEILCLPINYADADVETIENLAKKILVDAGVGEEDFGVYQKTIEADLPSKNEISLAIVGKMSDFCALGNFVEEIEVENDSAEAEDSAE